MNTNDQKKIINWIKNEKFSHLNFLEEEWNTSDNDYYPGYYYFILDMKNDNNDFVFDEIVKRKGSEAEAYFYLGYVAGKIFDYNKSRHTELGFYRKALLIDSNHADANWSVFYYTNKIDHLLKCLNYFYKNDEIQKIKNVLNNIYDLDGLEELSREELLFLKKILNHNELRGNRNIDRILIDLCFCLGDLEEGLEIINNVDKVNYRIIKKYIDENLITLEDSLLKINSFELGKIRNCDKKKIYEVFLNEAKAGGPNPTIDVLIQKAYEARNFNDVISHFEKANKEDKLIAIIDSHLYYLLAQIELDRDSNKQIYEYVINKFNDLNFLKNDKNSYFLFLILKFKLICKDLEKKVKENYFSNFSIENYSIFKEAEEILKKDEVVNNIIYTKLKGMLNGIKDKYHKEKLEEKLKEYGDSLSLEEFELSEFNEYCYVSISCENYENTIENINKFHKFNRPTMSTLNSLSICYMHINDYKNAFKYSKEALECMRSSKEYDYIVINNYLDLYKKANCEDVSKEEYNKLVDEFNLGLVKSFRWNNFLSTRFNVLYKYSPFNVNTIDALTNQYFFLPSKRLLNDPIELPELSKIRPDTHILENYNICSFSNNENSMLMWSHYAQQHQGIMVEYFFGGELPFGYGISKVDYADDKKRYKDKDEYIFNQFLLTKNKDWSYENEVRLFTFLNNKVEFETYKYPNPDRTKINASIKSITLGLNFPEDKKKLIGIIVNTLNAKKLPHESKISVKQAFLCEDNSYALEYRELLLDY
ncbi:TPA: DUF2971 domain-containing protein [Acinetobacter baumannii]|nr:MULTISPECIES: DUF2971 domain-containing protein [Acinetobacter calcoaceticus/baumannii complex]EXB91065.1 hypothetical protein J510_1763 [Acinetobacter baumannii 466760]EXR42055.1 hypothetical protein J655_1985 [Acinetobacter sp. 1294243]MBN6530132.1 DUF2971 domain-containing protein [Acinetobacter pittii]HAV5583212.1 DUF2971 domain-containing protein [Acinetobacter baumannii]